MQDYLLYDKITTTITINIWSLFKRSEKKKIALEYDMQNKEDNYLLNLAFATRNLGDFTKIYLKMPFAEYIKYFIANRKFKRAFGYCFTTKNKYLIEKAKLLEDARVAYKIDDTQIYEKIYDEFFGKEKDNV